MSLQFIIGSSGAGKSYFAYKRIIQESLQHPEKNYYVIVPEQFTMQTQKTLVEMHPGKGILNIDILSFERLAYRVFEETGGDNRKFLEDTGKSMVLQKMVQQHRKELAYLGSAGTRTIIWKVLLAESRTSLLVGVTIAVGTILGYSAMAGTVGGGGLGDIAIRYGYYRYQTDIMIVTIVILVVLVQILQGLGMMLSRKLDKRKA